MLFGIDGLVDEEPVAKVILNKLLKEEEEAISDYALSHPKERHGEIQFNLDQQGIATVSFSSVYRRLKEEGLIKEHHLRVPKHKKGKATATYVHQIWLLDISFISVKNSFWYFITVIDLYSRYIVGWDLSATMTSKDVQKTVDFALLQHGFYQRGDKPKIHSDNGSQMKAKSFKAFLKDLGMLSEYSRHQMKHPRQGIINWFVRQIIDKTKIKIYGDGKQIRDTNYVDDIVEALLLAIASEKTNGEVYNVDGFPISLKDIVEKMIKIYGNGEYELIPFPSESKKIEIGDYIADYSRLKKTIGWEPKIDINEGLKRTFKYYEKYKQYYW